MGLGNPNVFDSLLTKLESFEAQMNEYVMTIYASNELQDLATSLNEQQLQKGLRADGSVITPPYTPRTVSIKLKKGQPVDRVTLKDYGDFYNGLRLKQFPGKMEIVSQDEKSEQLQEKYKPEILGVSDEGIVKMRQYIYPLTLTHAKLILLR